MSRRTAAQLVTVVVAARPNFVKLAPVVDALLARGRPSVRLLHTGQHYDNALSGAFLEQLGMPEPDENLEIRSGTHAEQTARALVGVERDLARDRPDAVVVAGDVNSTLAAALAAAKLGIPIVHVESGLRSGDWTMPEEINRVLTDRLTDLLLCTSADAVDNLRAEGIAGDHVALIGNTMIDSLRRLLPQAGGDTRARALGLDPRGFALVTLHRPAVVDDPGRLAGVLGALNDLAAELPVAFTLHPRTRERVDALRLRLAPGLMLLGPLGYFDFVALESVARLVITDSGGVQEETSALGVPCLTYRDSTERPVTLELGTNRLVGTDPAGLTAAWREELAVDRDCAATAIPLWDGHAGERAAAEIARLLERLRASPKSRAQSSPAIASMASRKRAGV